MRLCHFDLKVQSTANLCRKQGLIQQAVQSTETLTITS